MIRVVTMWIVPKAGLRVRDPVSMQLLPEAGAEVSEFDQHWNRALMSGDVVRGIAPAPESPPAPAPTPPVVAEPPQSKRRSAEVKPLSNQDKE
jgi:hypothetical protein